MDNAIWYIELINLSNEFIHLLSFLESMVYTQVFFIIKKNKERILINGN